MTILTYLIGLSILALNLAAIMYGAAASHLAHDPYEGPWPRGFAGIED